MVKVILAVIPAMISAVVQVVAISIQAAAKSVALKAVLVVMKTHQAATQIPTAPQLLATIRIVSHLAMELPHLHSAQQKPVRPPRLVMYLIDLTLCIIGATVICHTHQHHVTRTQYQCEQGFFHDEEVLVCQDDSHHHHRKDYYAGNDDDNFEDDPEFGLYDFNQFDEECDIDHGVVNDYDQEDRYYKYKGKKYYDDSEYDDDEEEDDDEDEDEDDDEDDDEEEDEDEGKGKDRHY